MKSEQVQEALIHLEEAANHLQAAAESLAELPKEKMAPLLEALLGGFVSHLTTAKKEKEKEEDNES